MYVVEHALLNLLKNKGRNVLQGVIIFAIITAAVVALAIYNTSGYIIEETRTALQCAVRVAPRLQTVGGANQGAAVVGQGSQIMAGGPQGAADGGQESATNIEQYMAYAESGYLDGSDVKADSRSAGGVDAVYYLKQPNMLAAFEAELREKGLPDDYIVRTDESAFESIVGPVEGLNKLSLTFLIIVLALGAIILALLSAITIRERKYEIGVLRAMGMKKKIVAICLWIEIIAVAIVCFTLGAAAGSMLSQPVSDSMMAWQAKPAAATSQVSSLADRLGDGDAAAQPRPERLSIDISGPTMFEILGISVALASIAGLISVSRITKSEPIKILMERN